MNNEKESIEKKVGHDPTVVACIIFQTQDPEQLIHLLREALTGIADPISAEVAAGPQLDSCDPWLKHPEAAQYLGVSTSTLYRYACQHRIEARKLCGRLEYRRSTLDRFKDLHIRPASRWLSSGRIIPAALGSGK
jgi:excisionase family DNA binding protein